MIVRMLQALSTFALVSACIVFALCAVQWRKDVSVIEPNPEFSIVEKFRHLGVSDQKSNNKTVSPLVEHAEAFALYLNPPKPKGMPISKPTLKKRTTSAVRPVRSKPKFTLVATSYYRSCPSESMALVSEPGTGYRWIKQGQRLGHFVVEGIEPGSIAYRNGEQLLEMAVNTDISVIIEPAGQTTLLASNRTNTSLFTTANIRKQNIITQKTVQRTIPTRMETRSIVSRRVAVQASRAVLTSDQTSTSPPRSSNSHGARAIKHKAASSRDSVGQKTHPTIYDRRKKRT